MADIFDLSNPVFSGLACYTAIILLKTLVMSFLTAYFRITRFVFANQEDCNFQSKKDLKPITGNEEVERVRRCHQNDLENVFPFVLLGLLYTATGPALSTALWHFRVFALSRILHTIVYLNKVPQPSRALCFFVGMAVNLSMAVRVLQATGLA